MTIRLLNTRPSYLNGAEVRVVERVNETTLKVELLQARGIWPKGLVITIADRLIDDDLGEAA